MTFVSVATHINQTIDKILERNDISALYLSNIEVLIDIFKAMNSDKFINSYLNKNNRNYPSDLPLAFSRRCRKFAVEVSEYLNNPSNFRYLYLTVIDSTLKSKLENLQKQLKAANKSRISEAILISKMHAILRSFFSWFDVYKDFVHKQQESDKLIDELKKNVGDARKQVQNINSAVKAIDGQKTEEIYSNAYVEYKDEAVFFECWFYLVTFIGGMSVMCTLIFPDFRPNDLYDLITIRVIIFSLTITLATLFLRKSSHLRKLSDQAKQTSLELQALPTFITELDKADQKAIYKELASKYFGKELDQSQNDKIGDLMKEQLIAGTELIKASAELVKTKDDSNLKS